MRIERGKPRAGRIRVGSLDTPAHVWFRGAGAGRAQIHIPQGLRAGLGDLLETCFDFQQGCRRGVDADRCLTYGSQGFLWKEAAAIHLWAEKISNQYWAR